MTCEKQLSIEVIGVSCVNWENLDWGTATTFNGSFTPSETTGSQFNLQLNNGVSQAFNIGTVEYNGPGCDCNIEITITGQALDNDFICKVSVDRVSPFVSLMCFGSSGAAAGVYNAPFSMPDTGGLTQTFEVNVSLTHGLAGYMATGIEGVITNV